ncbi:MAG: hypothetical protein K0R24_24 [Gammaproteobacteria bacterium]|jgi:hypothetical protein|nr:hypothetical protein [Gammaproteobacteria bacterium]
MFRSDIRNALISEINDEFKLLVELLKAQSEIRWPNFMGNEQLRKEVIEFFRDAFNSVVAPNDDGLNVFAYNHQIHQSLKKMRALYLGPWPVSLGLGTAHPGDISATFVTCWSSRTQRCIEALTNFMRPAPISSSPPIPSPIPNTEPYLYYVLKEVGIGAFNGLIGIPKMILNLEQTARGLWFVATNPVSAARAIGREAYNRPYRMAANLLTGYLVNAYLIPKLLPFREGPGGLGGPRGPSGPGDNVGMLQNPEAAANMVVQESTQTLENAVRVAQEAKEAAEIAEKLRAAAVAANTVDAAELSRLTADAAQATETFQRAAEAAEAARLAAEGARSASGLFRGPLPVAGIGRYRNGVNSAAANSAAAEGARSASGLSSGHLPVAGIGIYRNGVNSAVANSAATEKAAELARVARAAHQTLQEAQQALQVAEAARAANAAHLLEVTENAAKTAQAIEGATRAVEVARATNIANIEELVRASHNAAQVHQAALAARATAEANFAAASATFSMANDRVVEATQANEIIGQLSQRETSIVFDMALERALNESNELEMTSISQSHFSLWNESSQNVVELSSDEENDLREWVSKNRSSSNSNYRL